MADELSWPELQMVLHVAEAGSMSDAARALGVEQSTLSRRLDRLETRLGERLFVRHTRGARPTPTAERLLPHARIAQDALRAAERTLAGERAAVQGSVRIAVPEAVAEHIIAPRLPELLSAHPKLRVTLVEGPEVADLGNNRADLAVRLFRPEGQDLVARRLGELSQAVYAHRDYCAKVRGAPARALRWIGFGGEHQHVPEARFLARHGIEPTVACERFTTVVSAVRAGVGACLMADALAGQFPELQRLPLPEMSPPAGEVWLVTPEALRRAPHVAAAWEFIEGLMAPPQRPPG